jgi:hypothetical protein
MNTESIFHTIGGITFTTGGRTGNTLRAHRMIDWCFRKGGVTVQNKALEKFWVGYFE